MTKRQSRLLIFLCWAIYCAAYVGRYSYNSNNLPISQFYGVSDMEIGLVSSCFFFAYGAGQIINGLLCRYYNMKYVLPCSVIVSSIINVVIYCGVPFQYFKYLWLLNGLAQSVLWSSLLLILSRNLDEKYIKIAIVAMSTTVSLGTFLSYGISAVLATFGGFKWSFFIGATLMTLVGIIWIFTYDKITNKNVENKSESIPVKRKTDKSVYKILVLFGVIAIIVNLIKDGLVTWVPKILFDTFSLPESLSIILTLIVPVLAIFGTYLVVSLSKKIKEYSVILAIIFAGASILTGGIIALLSSTLWGLILAFFGILSLLMSGANNVVTSILPLSLRDRANSGFVGGILNGCCYLGSTISSAGLGAISDAYGEWTPVFWLLFIMSLVVVLICVVSAIFTKISNKKKANLPL